MKHRSIISAGVGVFLATGGAWAQNATLTENINNTGIPRQVPALGLPAIYGLNPCSTGTSVGVATPLFGVGGAISSIDRECETRNNAAVVITGLKDEVLGREILCEIKDVREAAIRVGKPCIQDHAEPKISSAERIAPPNPDVAVKVRPVAVEAPPSPTPVLAAVRADAPAFCRIKDLDIRLYPDCTTRAAPASTVGPSGVLKQQPRSASMPGATKAGAAASMPAHRPDKGPTKEVAAIGAPHTDRAMLMALEKNLFYVVESRRMELARIEAGQGATPSPSQRHSLRESLLASATIEDQQDGP